MTLSIPPSLQNTVSTVGLGNHDSTNQYIGLTVKQQRKHNFTLPAKLLQLVEGCKLKVTHC